MCFPEEQVPRRILSQRLEVADGMSLAQRYRISDVCIVVADIERSIAFYTEKLGFQLRRRAESFADFQGAGIILAAWEGEHLQQHTGAKAQPGNVKTPHQVCIAIEVASPSEVDGLYEELQQQAVPFVAEPRDYPWNARCAYFTDPDGTLWELYAWCAGGPEDTHQIHEETSP